MTHPAKLDPLYETAKLLIHDTNKSIYFTRTEALAHF